MSKCALDGGTSVRWKEISPGTRVSRFAFCCSPPLTGASPREDPASIGRVRKWHVRHITPVRVACCGERGGGVVPRERSMLFRDSRKAYALSWKARGVRCPLLLKMVGSRRSSSRSFRSVRWRTVQYLPRSTCSRRLITPMLKEISAGDRERHIPGDLLHQQVAAEGLYCIVP